jgi:uncharacterized protein YfaS (alpha-2-macroglobulin family)
VDYGSAVRDQLATAVLLRESGLLRDQLTKLVARLPGADLTPAGLNTQEQAWAVAVAAALGRDGRAADVAVINGDIGSQPRSGGARSVMLTGPVTVKNQGRQPVWQSVAITGVPVQGLPAARSGMRISRRFLNLDGTPLNLDLLRQNTVFILVLDAKIEDGQAHTVMITQGLPAGWEIAGRIQPPAEGGSVPGMSWLDGLTATDAQPAADDRYAAISSVAAKQTDLRLAVRLRAVTPGSFALPGAAMGDMYRPALFARQAEGRVKILPLD